MPDFGIFRGFNDNLFGDKLYAGQLPINLGLIGSGNFTGVDIDALAFFTRVTAAGGTLSATEQTAIDTLVKQMKFDGIWDKMKIIYPMVGSSAAACAQNLKSSSFTGTFNGGWTFASTGAKPNGLNASLNTSFNWFDNTQIDNCSFGCYWRNIIASGNYYGLNEYDGGIAKETLVRERLVNSDFYINTPGTFTNATLANGLHCATRLNLFEQIMYVNGTTQIIGSRTVSQKPNRNFTFASALGFIQSEHQFAYISEGINSSEALNFYNAVQAFQTTLSRQV